jgi:hypothetical protein
MTELIAQGSTGNTPNHVTGLTLTTTAQQADKQQGKDKTGKQATGLVQGNDSWG